MGRILAILDKSCRSIQKYRSLLPATIRVRLGLTARWRRRDGVAVGRLIFAFVASLQPGTGSGVGGKGRWTAIAVPPQTESAGGRGKIATAVSGVTDMVDASGMPPGPARVRASLYGHTRPLARES